MFKFLNKEWKLRIGGRNKERKKERRLKAAVLVCSLEMLEYICGKKQKSL